MTLKRIFNPILFQGNLNKTNYFEGWYYKNVSDDEKTIVSFIPGISLFENDEHSFIQYIYKSIDENSKEILETGYCRYSIDNFSYNDNPFKVQIGKSVFTENFVQINIEDESLSFMGQLDFGLLTPIKKSITMPNIMGYFGYIPAMECYHGLISMKHSVNGQIAINHKNESLTKQLFEPETTIEQTEYNLTEQTSSSANSSKIEELGNTSKITKTTLTIDFNNGSGYIEKDWGTSFPRKYIWMQCNHFENESVSIVFSVADIPFGKKSFEGYLCNFCINGEEYRFATYNKSILNINHISDDNFSLSLENKKAKITITAKINNAGVLIAPKHGEMKNQIKEELSGGIDIVFKDKKTNHDFVGKGRSAGIEIVNY